MTDTVRVRLVWPESRGAKDDCRNHTKVVWSGHGDVQDYPAALWPRLAPHPDVWELVADAPPAPPPEPPKPLNGLATVLPPELAPEAVQEIKAKAAETATDVVVLAVPEEPPALAVLDAEALAEMPDEAVHAAARLRGFTLHPRLNAVNLRARFLEHQELDKATAEA